MAENPLNKPTAENKPSSGSNIETGDINVGGSVGGNIIVGQNITINSEQQAFRFLHQLPQPPADFTGRDDLIAQLLDDFAKGKGAAITGLIGMGGIGKTALGLVLAHQFQKDYPDAQIFLDLKGTTTPLTATDIMRHVILSFEPGMDLRALDEAGMGNAYQSVLHGKRALLFLDNARSAGQVAPLQPPETCALLVTSRWDFSVAGLQRRRLDVMSAENATRFLLELCPRIGEHTLELAKACAYLPLALRIAGSFLGVNQGWSIDKYVSQLNDRKGRLATLKESHAEAELTTEPDLLATFELSYNALLEGDQRRWRWLGVFPGSFDESAAAAIWELDEDATRKVLGLLHRYSLLDYDETSSHYSLHDLLADYTLSQMDVDEEQEARLKHASYYKDILRGANNLYRAGGENVLRGLRLFDLDWDNIRAAQAWVAVAARNSPVLSELCIAYPNVGVSVLARRQHPKERIKWLEGAILIAREIGDRYGEGAGLSNLGNAYMVLGEARKAIDVYEQALVIDRQMADRPAEGSDLGNLGVAYANLGEVPKAIEMYEQTLVICREIGDRYGEGAGFSNLGNAYMVLGEARKAIDVYEQALVICREIGDHHGEGNILGNLGNAYADLGEVRKAIEFYEENLAIAREIGDKHDEGNALGNLSIAYAALGDVRKAIEAYKQALVMDREISNRRGEANMLSSLGAAYANLGEIRKAIEVYEQALVIYRELGDRRGEGATLGNLGIAYAALGDVRKAIGYYEQQLAIVRDIGDRHGEGNALGSLGNVYAVLGEVHKAIGYYEQQLAIVRDIGDRHGEGNALGSLGIAYKNIGEVGKAIEVCEQALVICREIGDRHGEGNVLGNLGNVYAVLGEVRKAIEFYEERLIVARDIGDRRGEANALFNMGSALYSVKEKKRAIILVQQALTIFEAIESPSTEQVRQNLKEWGAL